jgi:hypothetical protein
MVEELKPCPFCGVKLTNGLIGTSYWSHPNIPTACPGARITISTRYPNEVEWWNTRSPDPATVRLREAVEAFVSTAVITPETHRVSSDEWVLSKCRAAISTRSEDSSHDNR